MGSVELEFYVSFLFMLDVFKFSLLCGTIILSCFYFLFVLIDPEPCIYLLINFIYSELCGFISCGLSVMCFGLYVCYKYAKSNQ